MHHYSARRGAVLTPKNSARLLDCSSRVSLHCSFLKSPSFLSLQMHLRAAQLGATLVRTLPWCVLSLPLPVPWHVVIPYLVLMSSSFSNAYGFQQQLRFKIHGKIYCQSLNPRNKLFQAECVVERSSNFIFAPGNSKLLLLFRLPLPSVLLPSRNGIGVFFF